MKETLTKLLKIDGKGTKQTALKLVEKTDNLEFAKSTIRELTTSELEELGLEIKELTEFKKAVPKGQKQAKLVNNEFIEER